MKNETNKTSKERIIKAAAQEFAEHGLAGARVDRIAEKAGANKAMIYYHFSSKEKLYQTIIEDHVNDIISSMKENIQSSQSLEDLLAQMALTHATCFGANPVLQRIFLRELAQPEGPMLDVIVKLIKGSKVPARIMELLREGKEKGELRDFDEKQALASFIGMNLGFYLIFPVSGKVLGLTAGKKFLEERQKAVVDIFLNGVKA